MSCERFRDAISLHVAGADLTPALAAHLAACDGCTARLEQQRRVLADVDAEIQRALAVDASPELVERVVARSRSASDAAWGFRVAWLAVPAAAALAIGIALRMPARVSAPSPESFSARNSEPRESLPVAPRSVPVAPGSVPVGSRSVPVAPESVPVAPGSVPVAPGSSPVAPGSSDPGDRSPRNPVRRAPVTPRNEPPVIVPPDQARAIARLRELMNEGLLKEEMLPPPRSADTASAELTVAPLEVPDIRVPEIVSRPPAAPEGRQ